MKKIISLITIMALSMSSLVGCGSSDKPFDTLRTISVVSRESGSGTRGAFVELFGIEHKDENGNKQDLTTEESIVANQTSVVMQNIMSDPYAIGYISLGSLNEYVKALKIDGAFPTAENIKNGTYKVARPFNIATKDDLSDVGKDFVSFIMSDDGQAVVAKSYISVDSTGPFISQMPTGKIVVSGSSSVTPIMEKLIEAYKLINTNAEIELQMSDSSSGVNSLVEGTCDIAMASRDLKDKELDKGAIPTVIAIDGIVVIVNKEAPIDELSSEQVQKIYTGEITKWNEILPQ